MVLIYCDYSEAVSSSIIIDPGHSERSPGTIGCSGTKEYIYNGILAENVRKKLSVNGITVFVTTDKMKSCSLKDRAAFAKGHDLLISIHHDSVQPQFVRYNAQTKGWCSNKARGFSLFVSSKNQDYEQSLKYATRLANALIKRGLRPTLHHAEPIVGENRILLSKELGIYKYDDLIVMKEAKSPAILLEAAVIVNPDDEKMAITPEYRNLIADAILEAIK